KDFGHHNVARLTFLGKTVLEYMIGHNRGSAARRRPTLCSQTQLTCRLSTWGKSWPMDRAVLEDSLAIIAKQRAVVANQEGKVTGPRRSYSSNSRAWRH